MSTDTVNTLEYMGVDGRPVLVTHIINAETRERADEEAKLYYHFSDLKFVGEVTHYMRIYSFKVEDEFL